MLRDIQQEFGIQDVLALTTDNASNMVVASRAADLTRVPCFAHTLQLAVNAGMKRQQISSTLAQCRRLVSSLMGGGGLFRNMNM